MKKISLIVGSKNFDITIDSQYDMESEFLKDGIVLDKNNDIKTLLYAYLSKTHKNLMVENEIDTMLRKLQTHTPKN